jgi:hypothetical protein
MAVKRPLPPLPLPPPPKKKSLLVRASPLLRDLDVGATLERVIVVGPYPVASFIEELRAKFKPKQIIIAVDDGWPIAKLPKSGVIRSVRADTADGLVHAKLYLFEWFTPGPNGGCSWRFAWGSANASPQGFESHAESLSICDLNQLDDAPCQQVLAFFEHISGGRPAGPDEIELGRGMKLLLPIIRPASAHSGGTPSTFSAWLRRGVLCHKFEPAGDFGRLSIKLRNPEKLPPDSLHGLLKNFGLAEDSASRSVHKRYAGTESRKEDRPQWRSKFFVETIFGHWTSRRCFETPPEPFILGSKSSRTETIETIRGAWTGKASPANLQWSRWIGEFLAQVAAVADGLEKLGCMRRDHFKCDKKGNINYAAYRLDLNKKLMKDWALASRESFRERFIGGYEFPNVPALGPSATHFETSLCESLLRRLDASEATEVAPRSRLARKIGEIIGTEFDDGEHLAAALRTRWNEVGTKIDEFHVDLPPNADA